MLERKRESSFNLAVRFEVENAMEGYAASKDTSYLAPLDKLLLSSKAETLDTDAIAITDTNGKVLSSTEKEARNTTIADASYFKKGLERDGFSFIYNEGKQQGRLYFTSKIVVEGKYLGMLVEVFTSDELMTIVQDYAGLGKTGETLLTETIDNKAISIIPLRFDSNAAFKADLSSLQLTDTINGSHTDLIDYHGHSVMVVARYLDLSGWSLATKIDRTEAFTPLAALRNTLISMGAISSVAMVLAAIYLAKYFTAPIVNLTNKARLIMQGDLSQRIDITSSDEVGTLATTFNTMTANLQKLYQGLEQKIAERTHQLSQTVQELQEANAKDQAILASMGEGLIVTDNQGHLMLMNPTAKKLLDVNELNFVGQELDTIANLIDESGSPFLAKNMLQGMGLDNQVQTYMLTLVNKDNTKTAIGMTITLIAQDDKILGAIGILRDRTKESEVDRMKTEFISIASHQLRTPLSAIRWFSEMLMAGDVGELQAEQREFITNISSSTDRMIDLVNSLLNISRIESGRIIIDPKPTDLRELVQGIINDLKGKTEEKTQTLTVSVHEGLPIMNIDPHLIGQVYLNLLTNAIKYTPARGEITVMISRKGNEIISQVSDNGYGIPIAEQGKLFQKFFRASNIAKVETDGTGLGMYLVKSIVETSGGKIWFKSEEGKGTTFWFSLPIEGMKAKAGEVTLG
jgi:signal transduction histidine kinase